ncbi:MAG: recombination regulator RecX [Firmicutes bacterium]|nr:recombination regulator RecX [Bacillota bacterium]
MPDAALKKAREKCYKLLASRSRTVHELQTRLAKAGFETSVIEAVLASLAEQNLLDDRQFAREWIASRLAAKAVGSRYLWAELLQKGVDREIIAGELRDYDEDCQFEAALRLAYAKMKPDAAIKWRRLEGLLLRRGFGRSVINKVYRTIVEGGRFDIS